MLIKVFAFSISHFSTSTDPLAIEKSAEEGKDLKEDADKKDKKFCAGIFTQADYGHLLCFNHLPPCIYSYIMLIGSKQVKTVPTPPPDHLV